MTKILWGEHYVNNNEKKEKKKENRVSMANEDENTGYKGKSVC